MNVIDLMAVNIPTGKVGEMEISKFEAKYPRDWTAEDDGRTDVISPVEYTRMGFDGRAPNPGWYTRLSEGEQIWMSDTTAERRDHVEAVFAIEEKKAERVLINGLGIGMVLTAALSYDHVRHVDVVEIDQRVIDLVGPYYLKDSRVRIHHANAVEKMRDWGAGERWDVGWSDIWPEISPENLPEMSAFSDFYGSRCAFHGNWSEDIVKRMVWDSRHLDKGYLEYLTEEDEERFEKEDEELYEDEDEDEEDW